MFEFKPGFIPSPEDSRDARMPYSASIPREVKAKYQPDFIYNQGSTSTCVTNAIGWVINGIERKQRGLSVRVSRGQLYGNRKSTDYLGEGMIPSEALSVASKFGVVVEDKFPELGSYDLCKTLMEMRVKTLDGDGIPQRIKGYVRLGGLTDICDFIERFEVPIIFGAVIAESFLHTGADGVIPLPSGGVLGGHEMVIDGVMLHNGKYKFTGVNSWGEEWGNNGRFILDPDYYGLEVWGLLPEVAEDIVYQPRTIIFTLNSKNMFADDKLITLLVPPQIIGGRTMSPLREPFEAMGFTIKLYKMSGGNDIIVVQKGGEMIP